MTSIRSHWTTERTVSSCSRPSRDFRDLQNSCSRMRWWLSLIFIWQIGTLHGELTNSVVVSVLLDTDTGSYRVINGTLPNRVAWANFSDQITTNGWSFLKVVTNASYPDGVQAYAAGLAEGHLTTNLLYYHWMNTVGNPCEHSDVTSGYCERLWTFLQENREWMKERIAKNAATDPYWHQVDLLLKQMQGIQDGCQNSFLRNVEGNILKDFGFLFFNLVELPSLQNVLNRSKTDHRPESGTAFVKILANNSDLYVGHNTWLPYHTMLRILKKYELHYHKTEEPGSPLVPGLTLAFTSYPGLIFSHDDYTLISTGLVVTETTLRVYNEELWKNVGPKSLLAFLRINVANRLASDGQAWTTLYFKHTMGTYCSQWMIIDYNKFIPETSYLNDNLLWVAEEVPGLTKAADRTSNLRRNAYWASYNIPYFPEIDEISHNSKRRYSDGDFYSYENSPRALIFKRDQDEIVSETTALRFLRYNDFENDPLSICANCTPGPNAMNAIAGRGDLNPFNGSYPNWILGHGLIGATDAKLTNFAMSLKLRFVAWSGPTSDQQRPFRWSEHNEDSDLSHMGHPDLWDFQPLVTQWEP